MGGWSQDDEPESPRQARERENGLRQVDRALALVEQAVEAHAFELTIDVVCELHRIAMDGLVDAPGEVRSCDVVIRGSRHEPPPFAEVPGLLDAMCDYANGSTQDAIHVAAYVLWRLNWIHPFAPDGNGRTARAAALVVLFARLGREPVTKRDHPTFLQRLSWRPLAYRDALEAADAAWKTGTLDVGELEDLLYRVLVEELEPLRPQLH